MSDQLTAFCPSCMSKRCPSLSDPDALCPERALRGLTEDLLQLTSAPDGTRALARTLAQCVLRLDALEKHVADQKAEESNP